MNLKRIILIFLCVLGYYSSLAQQESGLVQSRVLILLDESSSMIQPWASGKEKYKAAHELIMRLMDSVYAINRHVEFGLRVFGHQHTVPENDCYDTKNEVAFSQDNRSQMAARLDDIHPLGVTPLAFALSEAANKDIIDESHNAYSIILITDGGESCGGDICEVMRKLMKYKVYFKPYIVSLENDPSLRVTYSCMGDFLQVTKEKDIPKAVSTIVEAFRPIIKLNSEEFKELQKISENAPSVLKVTKPAIKTDTVAKWTPPAVQKLDLLPVAARPGSDRPAFSKVTIPAAYDIELPKVVAEPLQPVTKMAALQTTRLNQFNSKPVVTEVPLLAQTLDLPKVAIDQVDLRQADKLDKVKPARIRQFNVIFVIEDHTYGMRQLPPLPLVKPDPSQPAAETAKKPEVKIETVDSKETTLSVYFTNGQGKFYTTTPQIAIIDPATKKQVKKFFRTVDPSGNPDPQPDIPPGVYDLTLISHPEYYQTGVKIEINKNNKIIITVKNPSLTFEYNNAPGRPVKEFMAVVTERNKAQGRVQEQRCNELLTYEAGNYHIEINTFPMDVRNADLDFGTTVIGIDQPGFAKFTGDGKIQKVTLYRTYGDKFQGFYSLDLSDPAKSHSQHLPMQPGTYQVHYQKGPGGNLAAEQVQLFVIKATKETEVIIK